MASLNPSDKHIITIKTSITLETSPEKWGPDRIVLDGIQNHLPGDSGGTSLAVNYLFGGRWVPHANARPLALNGPPQAIEFADNGRGFDYHKLELIFSDKPNGGTNGASAGSVGQFGEGLKMIAAACLRADMPMQIRSRDWLATPRVEERTIDAKTAHQLVFDIETGLKPIRGSRTIFMRPTEELVSHALDIDKTVLLLRPGYAPLYSDGNGNSVVDERGELFVKGIFITSSYMERLIYSYDLRLDDLPRDRDHVEQDDVGNAIGELLSGCGDERIIRKVLERLAFKREDMYARRDKFMEPQYIDCKLEKNSATYREASHPEVWKKVFEELFGENAVLLTDFNLERLARLAGHEIIVADHIEHFMQGCGVRSDKDVSRTNDAFLVEDIGQHEELAVSAHETSITLPYRAAKWGGMRMVLDAVSNHLPEDSGGRSVRVEFKIMDPKSRQYTWVDSGKCPENCFIERARISDDGRGYSHEHLALLLSEKPREAVGRFGEGLKLLSTAALRDGVQVKFQSRDWVAQPFSTARGVDGREVEVLCYKIVSGIRNTSGSVTTFGLVDRETADVLRNLPDYVLPMRDDMRPIHSTDYGTMFREAAGRRVPNGSIFNKGIFISREYATEALFSYDLRTDDVSPDRDKVNHAALQQIVAGIVSTCTDREAIATILKAAEKNRGSRFLEFVDATLPDEVATAWKEVFYDTYGSNAVLSTDASSGMDASHLGFRTVALNENIANTLHTAGVERDKEVSRERFVAHCIPEGELTGPERGVLCKLALVDEVLGLPPFGNIRVYDRVRTMAGRDMTSRILGFWDGTSVHIKRAELASFASAVCTYTHERGHKETRAGDPDDRFREFFEQYLTSFICAEVAHREGDPSARLTVDPFVKRDRGIADDLEKQVLALDAQIVDLKRRLRELENQNELLARQSGQYGSEPVTFEFEGRTVRVSCPAYSRWGRIDETAMGIIEEALLGKRKGLDRMFGWFGRPNWVERKVRVEVTDQLDSNEKDAKELLSERKKVRLLRRIVRSNGIHGSDVGATQAVANRRKKFER